MYDSSACMTSFSEAEAHTEGVSNSLTNVHDKYFLYVYFQTPKMLIPCQLCGYDAAQASQEKNLIINSFVCKGPRELDVEDIPSMENNAKV